MCQKDSARSKVAMTKRIEAAIVSLALEMVEIRKEVVDAQKRTSRSPLMRTLNLLVGTAKW